MIEKEIIKILTKNKETIATMESCTGGGVANSITNQPGASSILKFSAITYSNEYKIKMGVPKETIDKYSVYSQETARAMAKAIATFADSTYGVGITGKLNKKDPANPNGLDNVVFITIYDAKNNKNYDIRLEVENKPRSKNKEIIINKINDTLLNIIKNSKKC